MACNNCYNGCVETTSDRCVRYTGLPSEALGIETNDSLYVVEEALINAVVSFLDGTGIDITIDPEAYCTLVTQYLPTCKPICSPPTAVELFEALVKAACDLQGQVDVVAADLAELNSDYTIDCLDGVTSSSSTHEILQATINKLCELGVDLAALALDVDTNYVKLTDLNTLIQAYLDSTVGATSYYTKMVPYTVVEYYGVLTGFDITGAGTGIWEKIYLCNGQNGTPDKRGRVGVGAIVAVGGGALSPEVDPVVNPTYNPNYALLIPYGTNSITLNSTQIPVHTHTITDNGHYTDIEVYPSNSAEWATSTGSGTPVAGIENVAFGGVGASQTATTTVLAFTGITATNSTGSGGAHSNTQPVLPCYYIMYIP